MEFGAIAARGMVLLGCGTMADLRKQANRDGSLEDLFMKITEEDVAEVAK